RLTSSKNEFNKIAEYSERSVTVYNENLMGVKVRFFELTNEKNIHSHDHEQLTLVTKGSFKFYRDDEEIVVTEGDSLLFESNVDHGCIPLEINSELFDVFSPLRTDFL